jgi:cytochrome bd ubiquinol oxidase subunit II
METVWFCLVAVMIAVYVVLDGFDLGAGAIHLLVARNDAERRTVLRTIGPVWDGNEVWLLAAGGTLYFAFPALYASSFSGFYLPLMIVLWLLILRGVAVEFRNQIASPLWSSFWDVAFSGSSLLLAVFYGAALGNVVRGVPLDDKGYFFEALWTNFRLGPNTGILDWYTLLVGVGALCALVMHGAFWVALKTEGEVNERSRRVVGVAWWGVGISTIVITYFTFEVQPHVESRLFHHPWVYIFPVLAIGGVVGARLFLARQDDRKGFLASCAYLAGMLTSLVFGLYPLVLPASTNPAYSLTVENAKAGDYGLRIGLVWWVLGMFLAAGYFIFTYRNFAGKIRPDSAEDGY